MPATETALLSEEGSGVPYGEAVMKTTHNAYDRDEPLFDQFVYHGIRSVELDVHVSRARVAAPASEWFVYHADLPFFRDTSCAMLSDCLGQIAAFHEAVPKHEVVTVFVDLKDDFGPGHGPRELDDVLEKTFGRDVLLEPKDLLGRCSGASTVRAAVTGACAFPKLADLRGKIVVAVTGGSLCERSPLARYAGDDATSRGAFLAPELSGACPIERYDARGDVVFLNMALRERHRAASVRERGLIARLYGGGLAGGLDSAAEFFAAHAAGVQVLATDMVNAEAEPWATTSTGRGWPFRCAGCSSNVEAADLVAVRARSGDLGGPEDSAYFAYESDYGESTWSTFVSVASSFVEPDAKGCLMARASEDANARAVALCRPVDQHPPRLLVRTARGGLASWIEMASVAGLSPETPAFLRLSLVPRGDDTEVEGEASADGRSWKTIARTTIAGALPLRGIAAASSGPSAVKTLFGNLRRTKGGVTERLRAEALSAKTIGAAVRGELFDGIAP